MAPVLSGAPASDSEKLYVDGEFRQGGLCFKVLCRAPGYDPADYRSLSSLAAPAAVEAAALASVDGATLRRIVMTQSAQLWQVASQVDDHLGRAAARIDHLEQHVEGRLRSMSDDLQDILSFVRGLRSSLVYKVGRRAGELLRRKRDET